MQSKTRTTAGRVIRRCLAIIVSSKDGLRSPEQIEVHLCKVHLLLDQGLGTLPL